MARATKKSAAALRGKLKAAAARRGRSQPLSQKKPKAVKGHLEITKERIRLGCLLYRLEAQALGDLPRRGKKAMTGAQQAAAQYLVDKFIPKAAAPLDVNLAGTIIVEERDPTQRPPGYHRKPVQPSA
jgi:hypothetical protein